LESQQASGWPVFLVCSKIYHRCCMRESHLWQLPKNWRLVGARRGGCVCDLASTIMHARLAAYQRIHHVQCSCAASWRKDSGA
jgi:hypothetical protein